MTCVEDRENELLALESIYEDHFQVINSSSCQKFAVRLKGQAGSFSAIINSCQILFKYTENYPNEGPEFEIIQSENLSDCDLDQINQLIQYAMKQSLGCVMIFDILSEVQEKLNLICDQLHIGQKRAIEDKRKAVELEEEAKFQGDRVTVESFLKWHANFIAETQAVLENKKLNEEGVSKRMTGRALFLTDHRYDDSDLTFLDADNGEVVEIDERLFGDIGEIDLNANDLDDDDDIGDCYNDKEITVS